MNNLQKVVVVLAIIATLWAWIRYTVAKIDATEIGEAMLGSAVVQQDRRLDAFLVTETATLVVATGLLLLTKERR